ILDTLNLNGTGNTRLEVKSNDPRSPQLLTVRYSVVSRLAIEPGFGRWLTTAGERGVSVGHTVWSLDGKDFHVVRVETPLPQMIATFRPATDSELRPKAS